MKLYDLNDIELAKVFAVEVAGWKLHDHPDCMARKDNWSMPEKWCMTEQGVLVFNHDMEKYAKIEHILPFLEKEIWERTKEGDVKILKMISLYDEKGRFHNKCLTVFGMSEGVNSFARAASIALINLKFYTECENSLK